jgi:hypothetical protein
MQAALQLLHQDCLTHLQVCLLQAEKDLVLLQRPVEVGKLFLPRTGHACLGEEIPLDSISMDTTSIAFHTHLPKRACKGRQSIVPRDHDTLSAIQLPLPSKELPLQLNGYRT